MFITSTARVRMIRTEEYPFQVFNSFYKCQCSTLNPLALMLVVALMVPH
jgi:hypothetical protein